MKVSYSKLCILFEKGHLLSKQCHISTGNK